MRCFINGVFFQRRSELGVGYKPSEGAVAVVRDGTFQFPFRGFIDTESEEGPPGAMQDQFGPSELHNVILTDTELGFTKSYDRRSDTIEYRFRKLPDGSWVGHYEGEAVGRGVARCMLTPVPDDFFDARVTLEHSQEKGFHEWGKAATGG